MKKKKGFTLVELLAVIVILAVILIIAMPKISDENSLRTLIIDILNNNEKAVLDYKNGLDRSIKFLMGQIMKETRGQANPVLANDILLKELENRK